MIAFTQRTAPSGVIYTNITMTRGDDAYIAMPVCNADGSPYTVTGSDTVAASVKDQLVVNSTAVTPKFTGTVSIENGVPVWHIDSTDSDIDAGDYYWDVQITTSDGDISTFYSGKFTIIGEVTA